VDSDASPVVNLEVTVPVLPAGLHRHGLIQAPATSRYSESNEGEEVEQVRLVAIGLQKDPSLHQPREQAIGDVPVRMIHSIRFRVFHLTVPAHGQPFLLQVLRRYNEYIGKKPRKRNQAKEDNAHARQLYVSDAMAFSVEFRSSSGIGETTVALSTPTSTPTLIPGMNRVVIYLDNEGTPSSYSIDGAES
jgi:hypothetical protein